jgi:CHAD domain-containing protein
MAISSERSQSVFRKTERALLQLSSQQNAESVHGFRTASLRLQTLLEQLLPERDGNQKKLLKMLKRIRKRAGKVRDLDVQLAALRSLKVPQEPRRKTQLMSGLIELRDEHEQRLNKLLKKDMIREIKKRLRRGLKELRPESSREALSVAQSMLKEVARPFGPVSEDVLHQYRRVVKRARYTVEFAPKSAQAALLVSQLKRLQDALGSWHDWLTLTQSAATRLGDVNQSSLVAALHNVTGGKFRHAVAALSASPTLHAAAKSVAAASSEQTRRMSTKGPTLVEQAESAA